MAAIASELDVRVRSAARRLIVPAAVAAATLAMPACAYGVPDEPDAGDATSDSSPTEDTAADTALGADAALDSGPLPAYMAPDGA